MRSKPDDGRSGRLPGLDLLRAVAIVIVVFYHAALFGFVLPGRVDRFGWIGVDLFFALSGYLIGSQLCCQLATHGRIALKRFFWRRALRIMPAYFTVLAIYLLAPAWREYPAMSPPWKFLLSVQNIGLHGGTAFSHAWSLAVEDQFYLTLPLVLMLAWRWPRLGRALPLTLFTMGLVVRGALAAAHFDWQTFIYYPTWSRLDPLVLGVAVASVQRFRPCLWGRCLSRGHLLWIPALAAIAGALALGEVEGNSVMTSVFQFPILACGMAALLVCVLSPRFALSKVEVPGAAFISSISYSVYLSHKLTIHAVPTHSQLVLQPAIYLGGTLLYLTVERPCLRWRDRISARQSPSTAV